MGMGIPDMEGAGADEPYGIAGMAIEAGDAPAPTETPTSRGAAKAEEARRRERAMGEIMMGVVWS